MTPHLHCLIPFLLCLLCLVMRFMFVGQHLEGWDDVDFAMALHDYDLATYQPHFPGYVLYIAFARVVLLRVNNDVMALVLPNIILGSLTVIPLYLLAANMFSRMTALLTAALYIVNPLCWLQAERPMPDTSGLFFILLSIQLIYFSLKKGANSTGYMTTGSFVLGVSLGVKLSYFPFVLSWLLALWLSVRGSNQTQRTLDRSGCRRIVLCSISAFIIGLCVWFLPLIALVGANNLMSEGVRFVCGHFSDWGGSIGTENNVICRVNALCQGIFANGLGFWWGDANLIRLAPLVVITTAAILNLLYPAGSASYRELIRLCKHKKGVCFAMAIILPYLTWVFFGQNLDKSRHLLPLIPVFLILISAGIIRSYLHFIPKIMMVSVLLVSSGTISARLVLRHRDSLSVHLQLINYVNDNFDANSTRIYCWETRRLFEYYMPTWDSRRVRNLDDLAYDLRSSMSTPEFILCTSSINGIEDHKEVVSLLRQFEQDRYIENVYDKLILYRVDTDKLGNP